MIFLFLLLLISLIVATTLVFVLKRVLLKLPLPKSWRLQNLTVQDMANYATLLAVVFGICLAFGIRKQLVQVDKVEDLELAMFEARQWLTSSPGFDDQVIPPFFVSGYIINNGDKVGVDYALEIAIKPRGGHGGVYNPYTAYVFCGANNVIPPISSLNWVDFWPTGSVEIRNSRDSWRISLPTVNPGSQVGVAMGLGAKATSELDRFFLKAQMRDALCVRLIKFVNGRTQFRTIDSTRVPIEELRYYDPRLQHGGE